jgi:hypothetical protein
MNTKSFTSKIITVLITIIILQSYLVPVISVASGSDYIKYTNYVFLYAVISYSIIVFSIIFFQADELEVFQDYFSLLLLIFTCFFRVSLGGQNEIIYRVILAGLGLVLVNYLITNRHSIKMPSLKVFTIGVLWSVGTLVLTSLTRVIFDPNRGALPPNLIAHIFSTLAFQLSFVTVIEEAYFRGLLFEFFIMKGVNENKALLFQGLLFWGMHYAKSSDLVLFLGVIPIITLSTTLVIKKYKMLYLSIMVHTVNNVFSPILVALIR